MANFTTYNGKFVCHTCKKIVGSIRLYSDTGLATWLCSEKHLTKVQLAKVGYKKKKGNEREE